MKITIEDAEGKKEFGCLGYFAVLLTSVDENGDKRITAIGDDIDAIDLLDSVRTVLEVEFGIDLDDEE